MRSEYIAFMGGHWQQHGVESLGSISRRSGIESNPQKCFLEFSDVAGDGKGHTGRLLYVFRS
jgi:hypothetical protein